MRIVFFFSFFSFLVDVDISHDTICVDIHGISISILETTYKSNQFNILLKIVFDFIHQDSQKILRRNVVHFIIYLFFIQQTNAWIKGPRDWCDANERSKKRRTKQNMKKEYFFFASSYFPIIIIDSKQIYPRARLSFMFGYGSYTLASHSSPSIVHHRKNDENISYA